MRRIIAIAISAAAFCAAYAASVPQTSADKYYFTIPRHPAGIKGVVMGDPPAYSVMRSEDISWIQEAVAERQALAGSGPYLKTVLDVPEFGKWPVSSNNGFRSWVTATFYDNGALTTNIIARYRTETNNVATTIMRIGEEPGLIQSSDFSSYYDGQSREKGYLDPSASTISSPQVVEIDNGNWPVVTNVTESVSTNWSGWYYDETGIHLSQQTNFTYLTMSMTNGTTSVHTNMWIEIVPREERNSVTNVLPMSWEPMVFTDCSPKLLHRESPQLKGLFRSSIITECYPILRDARRCLCRSWFETVSNVVLVSGQHEWSDDYIDGPTSTPATVSTGNWSGSYNKNLQASSRGGYDWHKSGRIYGSRPASGITAVLGSDIEYGLAFTGGVSRIEKAEVFAGIDTQYNGLDNGTPIPEVRKAVLLKVGETTDIAEGPGGHTVFKITFDADALCDAAMSAAGHSFPSAGWFPVSDSSRTYSAGGVWIGLIVHVRPWTSLPGW